MITAKCSKCGGNAIADTFEQARKLINHAVGLSRGIKCGDNYNLVTEIKPDIQNKPKPIQTSTIPKSTETLTTPKIIKTSSSKESKKQIKSSV